MTRQEQKEAKERRKTDKLQARINRKQENADRKAWDKMVLRFAAKNAWIADEDTEPILNELCYRKNK